MSNQLQNSTEKAIDSNQHLQQTDDITSILSTVNDHQTNIIHSISNSSNVNDVIINNDSEQVSSNSDDDSDSSDELSETKIYPDKKRLQKAEEYRLLADSESKLNNYEEAIALYTKSIFLNNSTRVYMSRAKAYFNLANYDACIQDCSGILRIIPNSTQALFHRASSYFIKKQYDRAKQDLEYLLSVDPDNDEAQNLLNNVLAVYNPNSNSDAGAMEIQSSTNASLQDPLLDNEDDERQDVNNKMTHSMIIETLKRQHNHWDNHIETSSPPTYDSHAMMGRPVSGLNDDEDDMALGDEAASGVSVDNPSDEDEPISRDVESSTARYGNVYAKNSIDNELLGTACYGSNTNKNNDYQTKRSNRNTVEMDDLLVNSSANNVYNLANIDSDTKPSTIHRNSSHELRRNYLNSWDTGNDSSTPNIPISQTISASNFGPIVQSWLQDSINLESYYHSSRFYDRPWSRSAAPWCLNKMQTDIEKLHLAYNYKDCIEISKKLLHNRALDYHHHTEYIVTTLASCAQLYVLLNDYMHAIQYTTEALQYDKNNSDTLLLCAEVFEKENLLLISYAICERIKIHSFNYLTTKNLRSRLEKELNSTEGEKWREKIPDNNNNDYEQYLTYLKLKNKSSDNNSYDWYRTQADQYYIDGCFILAIQFYTTCIELQPDAKDIYIKRAECYLNVFEPKKAIDDCDIVLNEDKTNFNALYHKASAYKISRDYRLHESLLRECITLQPTNQIVLAEYYHSQHEQIPRKKRRIRTNPTRSKSICENSLSYAELEEIRLNTILSDSSLNSANVKDQLSFILGKGEKELLESLRFKTQASIEAILDLCQIMVQAERNYLEKHNDIILSFSYTQFCFRILVEMAKIPQIDLDLFPISENHQKILRNLLSYYSSLSSIFTNVEQLEPLKYCLN